MEKESTELKELENLEELNQVEFPAIKDLVDFEIQSFILKYKNIHVLFGNQNNKNKLISALEYGLYKEQMFSDLFSFILPPKIKVGSGFILNSEKEITTQCDIILYDKINTPLIFDNGRNKFFTNECVYAIGEIKSKLKKSELCEALIKMAKNKAIRKSCSCINETNIPIAYNPILHHHNIFTFIICDEITDFTDSTDLGEMMRKKYEEANIPIHYRHNIIISLKDGLITYKTSKELENILNSSTSLFYPYPNLNEEAMQYYRFTGETIDILKQFIIHINNSITNLTTFYSEPANYIV